MLGEKTVLWLGNFLIEFVYFGFCHVAVGTGIPIPTEENENKSM